MPVEKKNMMTGLILCIVAMVTSAVMVQSQSDEVSVYVPGQQAIEYDYVNRLVVYRFFDDSEEPGPCYAREMAEEEIYVPNAQISPDEDDVVREWRPTYRELSEYQMSTKVERMCTGTYWLEEYDYDVMDMMGDDMCMESELATQCISRWMEKDIKCSRIRICKNLDFE